MLKKFFYHSLIFFILLITFNFIIINDFSVMGVKNDSITEIVKNDFIWTIVWAFFSQFLAYIFIAFLAAVFFNVFYHAYPGLMSLKKLYALLFIFQFSISMYYAVITPQYFNEFMDKIGFWADIFHFIILNIHPYFFSAIMIFYLVFFFHCLYKIYDMRIMLSAFTVFLCLLGAYHHIKDQDKDTDKKNILLISADSFRNDMLDSLKLFGKISRFGDVERLENMVTVIPRTFPSWASTFTGLYPKNHFIYNMFPQKNHRSNLINYSYPDLLRKNGYYTEVVSDFAGDIFSRMNLGFNKVTTPYFNFNTIIKQRILEVQVFLLPYLFNDVGYYVYPYLLGFAKFPNAKYLTDRTIKSIRESSKPYFICTFYSDLHFPYSARYPHYKSKKTYKGEYRYMKNQTLDGKTLSEPDKEHVQNLIWGAARTVRYEMNRIFDYLIESGEINNTIVLFMSDHGENVYEYEEIMGHGDHLYDDNTIKIPFLVFKPKSLENKFFDRNALAANIDIMPSIAELVNLKVPFDTDGKSLYQKDSNNIRFMETGLWFVNNNGEFYQEERIWYPDVTEIAEIEWANNNEPAIKSDYLTLTEKSKHRAIVQDSYKLIYIPLEDSVRWRLFQGEQELRIDNHISLYNELKKKFFKHFKDRFNIEKDYLYLK